MPNDPGNFEVFEDRVISLLKRWKEFKAKKAKQSGDGVSINISDAAIIKSCLNEINDGFTQQLMEQPELPVEVWTKECPVHGFQPHQGKHQETAKCHKCNMENR